MSATLKLTHKAIGAEVRRGIYDVVFNGERVGSVEMSNTIEIPVEPGRHTLQVRNGRNSSSTQTFDAATLFNPLRLAGLIRRIERTNTYALTPTASSSPSSTPSSTTGCSARSWPPTRHRHPQNSGRP